MRICALGQHCLPLHAAQQRGADAVAEHAFLDLNTTVSLAFVAPRSKINLGLGAYGRSWTLASPTQTAVGSPAYSAGQPGQCTRKQDVLLWLPLDWLRLADRRVAEHRPGKAGADLATLLCCYVAPSPLFLRAEQGGYIAWYEIKDKIAKGAKVGGGGLCMGQGQRQLQQQRVLFRCTLHASSPKGRHIQLLRPCHSHTARQ